MIEKTGEVILYISLLLWWFLIRVQILDLWNSTPKANIKENAFKVFGLNS